MFFEEVWAVVVNPPEEEGLQINLRKGDIVVVAKQIDEGYYKCYDQYSATYFLKAEELVLFRKIDEFCYLQYMKMKCMSQPFNARNEVQLQSIMQQQFNDFVTNSGNQGIHPISFEWLVSITQGLSANKTELQMLIDSRTTFTSSIVLCCLKPKAATLISLQRHFTMIVQSIFVGISGYPVAECLRTFVSNFTITDYHLKKIIHLLDGIFWNCLHLLKKIFQNLKDIAADICEQAEAVNSILRRYLIQGDNFDEEEATINQSGTEKVEALSTWLQNAIH